MSETKTTIRIPPNSKESEMIVIGCMLTKVNNLNVGADHLEAFHFYYTEHQTIFTVLKILFKQDKPADIHLVAEELKRLDKLDSVGGIAYLTTLAQYAGTSAYLEEYIELIKNKSILRQMIQISQDIEKTSLEEPTDVQGSLDNAQARFFAISQASNDHRGILVEDLISGLKSESGLPYLKELEEKQERYLEKGEEALAFTGLPTGFHDLDNIINGLAPSNLIILAGRPAMGKTAFGLNIAANLCFKHHLPIGIFSLEMSAEQLLTRMICSEAEVESKKILTGSLDGPEYQRIVETIHTMKKETLVIDDQPGLTITDLRARARRMKERYGIKCLIVDYLQLFSGSKSYGATENRQQEISDISRMLKALARELNIPIICLSQLSRKVEERHNHRPMMSDLRESGAIEQDADIVLLLFRREYYNESDKPGMGEVIVGKNRHGGTGTIEVAYRKETAQFLNYTSTDALGEEKF